MLRSSGISYREFEEKGLMLVVVSLRCDYFVPAKYDDVLTLKTEVTKARGVRIHHCYEISREDEVLAKGETTVACVNHDGKPTPLPKWLRLE